MFFSPTSSTLTVFLRVVDVVCMASASPPALVHGVLLAQKMVQPNILSHGTVQLLVVDGIALLKKTSPSARCPFLLLTRPDSIIPSSFPSKKVVGAVPKGFLPNVTFVFYLVSLQVNVGFALNGSLKLMGEIFLPHVGVK